jgi:hypothetical protein
MAATDEGNGAVLSTSVRVVRLRELAGRCGPDPTGHDLGLTPDTPEAAATARATPGRE